jgi:hypothetical protein
VVEGRLSLGFEEMLKLSKKNKISFRTACQISAAEELVASLRDRDWI